MTRKITGVKKESNSIRSTCESEWLTLLSLADLQLWSFQRTSQPSIPRAALSTPTRRLGCWLPYSEYAYKQDWYPGKCVFWNDPSSMSTNCSAITSTVNSAVLLVWLLSGRAPYYSPSVVELWTHTLQPAVVHGRSLSRHDPSIQLYNIHGTVFILHFASIHFRQGFSDYVPHQVRFWLFCAPVAQPLLPAKTGGDTITSGGTGS